MGRACKVHRIKTVFQPIVDVRKGQGIFGYEALVRGLSGEGASSVLARVSADDWPSFDHQCRESAISSAASLGLDGKLFLNVHPGAVLDSCYGVSATVDAAGELGLGSNRLVFELTENDPITSEDAFARSLRGLARAGISFAIDDFGSGFAGLSSLIKVRPNFLKISMDIVHFLEADRKIRDIIVGIGRFCRSNDCEVIAEGIETYEQMKAAYDAEIFLMQGYIFGKPSAGGLIDIGGDTASSLRDLDTYRRQLDLGLPQ